MFGDGYKTCTAGQHGRADSRAKPETLKHLTSAAGLHTSRVVKMRVLVSPPSRVRTGDGC